MNISGSLLEQLECDEFKDILEGFKTYLEEGRLELVGSAMYHPILVFLKPDYVKRQIELHDKISKRIFGDAYQPKGFFIPEMAYSKEVGQVIKDFGFSWIILDEAHFGKNPDGDVRYSIEGLGLGVIFRNRKFSKSFPPESILTHRAEIVSPYIITAQDGEIYGHTHKDDRGYFEKAFTDDAITLLTVGEYLSRDLSRSEVVVPRRTNWEATAEDIVSGFFFALWSHPKNIIHKKLWRFAEFATRSLEAHVDDPNYSSARTHLDRGLSSCSWWWASEAKPDAFSPITWNPSVIERGANEIIHSIRSLKNLPKAEKIRAEKMHSNLIFSIWKKHWVKYS